MSQSAPVNQGKAVDLAADVTTTAKAREGILSFQAVLEHPGGSFPFVGNLSMSVALTRNSIQALGQPRNLLTHQPCQCILLKANHSSYV